MEQQEKEYPLFPELNEQGKQEAQTLMNQFEATLKEKATELLKTFSTSFYCDILNEIESDHWQNYRTKIVNGICNYSNKNIQGTYDFDKIRKAIYESHKEEIDKDLNQDLLKEIERLKNRIEQLQQRY